MKLPFRGVSCTLLFACFVTVSPAVSPAEVMQDPAVSAVSGSGGVTEGVMAITPGFEPDYSGYYGPVIGGGLSIGKPGGEPYLYRMKLSGGFAPFSDFRGRLKFSGDFRTLVPQAAFIIDAATSGLDRLRYYGEGNERYFRGSGYSEDDFEIAQQVTTLGVSLRFPVQKNYCWSAGVGTKWVDLDIAQGSYADLHRAEIRGIDDSFSGSFRFGFHYDATDKSCSGIDTARGSERRSSAAMESNAAISGTMVDAGVSLHPVFFGNERTFTKLSGEVRRYIPVSSDRFSRVAF
ncbi:MAG: hypothetical protein HGB36_12850, partial [Chlorobiaceae bacterium]|nr:hypothetical protein [Chlorobiaceae bacterium]